MIEENESRLRFRQHNAFAGVPLAGRFNNIHLHDNNGKWDEHLILGTGKIDLKNILNRLRPSYKGNWVIECNKLNEGIESKKILERWLRP